MERDRWNGMQEGQDSGWYAGKVGHRQDVTWEGWDAGEMGHGVGCRQGGQGEIQRGLQWA